MLSYRNAPRVTLERGWIACVMVGIEPTASLARYGAPYQLDSLHTRLGPV